MVVPIFKKGDQRVCSSNSPAVEMQEDHCPPVITRADVCRIFKLINTRKAPGSDGIPGRALKVCAAGDHGNGAEQVVHPSHFKPEGQMGLMRQKSRTTCVSTFLRKSLRQAVKPWRTTIRRRRSSMLRVSRRRIYPGLDRSPTSRKVRRLRALQAMGC
ncbi:hypothetical protein L3Q82_004539 [Scortum barcoo]|uniref:Uncharacterized protein n=1 Tax=Scortum barcoo TaxID=214431 RepID=A0ACB8VHS4_9TELE|nr:hypothetical protein L3Q82_004539 [Scortum barcoo]